mmetsp:Transcript_12795/g.41693  ORF Transcript_12795/g.41693 Transcript_12795/m.41693 type:complete len:540 (+) Transcript_12795:274-1893(+)
MLGPLHARGPRVRASDGARGRRRRRRAVSRRAGDVGEFDLRPAPHPHEDHAPLRRREPGDHRPGRGARLGQDAHGRDLRRGARDVREAQVARAQRRGGARAGGPRDGLHGLVHEEGARRVPALGRHRRDRALELPVPQRLQPRERGAHVGQRHRRQGLGVRVVVRGGLLRRRAPRVPRGRGRARGPRADRPRLRRDGRGARRRRRRQGHLRRVAGRGQEGHGARVEDAHARRARAGRQGPVRRLRRRRRRRFGPHRPDRAAGRLPVHGPELRGARALLRRGQGLRGLHEAHQGGRGRARRRRVERRRHGGLRRRDHGLAVAGPAPGPRRRRRRQGGQNPQPGQDAARGARGHVVLPADGPRRRAHGREDRHRGDLRPHHVRLRGDDVRRRRRRQGQLLRLRPELVRVRELVRARAARRGAAQGRHVVGERPRGHDLPVPVAALWWRRRVGLRQVRGARGAPRPLPDAVRLRRPPRAHAHVHPAADPVPVQGQGPRLRHGPRRALLRQRPPRQAQGRRQAPQGPLGGGRASPATHLSMVR